MHLFSFRFSSFFTVRAEMTAAAARIRQAEIKDKFGRDHKESLSPIFFLLEFERRGTKRRGNMGTPEPVYGPWHSRSPDVFLKLRHTLSRVSEFGRPFLSQPTRLTLALLATPSPCYSFAILMTPPYVSFNSFPSCLGGNPRVLTLRVRLE